MIELMVVITIIAVLIAVYLPELTRQKSRAARISCVCHLKQIGLSFRIWAQDHSEKNPTRLSVTNGGTMELVASGIVWPHFQVMSNELSTPKVLRCPSDKRRTNALSFDGLRDFNVSYFVGVDAEESNPQMLLAGDDNLSVGGIATTNGLLSLWTNAPVGWTATRHVNAGNIGLADGSVQQVSSQRLQALSATTGVMTNRLVLP